MKRKASGPEEADSLKLEVSLPSGRYESVVVSQFARLSDLKIAAQQSLGQRFLRLAAPDGRLLDQTGSLELSGLQNGDSLTAVAQQPKVAATWRAFALWCVGSRAVTWGNLKCGGDSSGVQHQLRNVQDICCTAASFAAILAEGTVVTWGDPDYGGDSSRVQHQLRNVKQVCGTRKALAAILAEGAVVTWGDPDYGGDSSIVQHQLRNVQQIFATRKAFAAILANGTVVTWGHPDRGGNHSSVEKLFSHI